MDRAKILDKIRKCLALGKSPNEHEAAAALRQAQKLMELHGINEEEVGQISYTSELVVSDYKHGVRKPVILMTIVELMQHTLGVEAVFEHAQAGSSTVHAVRYFGPRARAMLAAHAHVVVYRAVGAAWRAYIKENPRMKKLAGARAGFYMGWCETVQEKVEVLMPSEEESKGTAMAKTRQYGSAAIAPASVGTKRYYVGAHSAGAEAGKSFDLRQPVGQNRLKLGRQ